MKKRATMQNVMEDWAAAVAFAEQGDFTSALLLAEGVQELAERGSKKFIVISPNLVLPEGVARHVIDLAERLGRDVFLATCLRGLSGSQGRAPSRARLKREIADSADFYSGFKSALAAKRLQCARLASLEGAKRIMDMLSMGMRGIEFAIVHGDKKIFLGQRTALTVFCIEDSKAG
jgi:hypothetical protein